MTGEAVGWVFTAACFLVAGYATARFVDAWRAEFKGGK